MNGFPPGLSGVSMSEHKGYVLRRYSTQYGSTWQAYMPGDPATAWFEAGDVTELCRMIDKAIEEIPDPVY